MPRGLIDSCYGSVSETSGSSVYIPSQMPSGSAVRLSLKLAAVWTMRFAPVHVTRTYWGVSVRAGIQGSLRSSMMTEYAMSSAS